MPSEYEREYAAAQAGSVVTVRTAALQWMLMQYDYFFFHGGWPWKLRATKKGPGVYLVSRERWTDDDRAAKKPRKPMTLIRDMACPKCKADLAWLLLWPVMLPIALPILAIRACWRWWRGKLKAAIGEPTESSKGRA